MPGVLNPEPMPNVMRASFLVWGRSNERYKALFATLPKAILEVAYAAFTEMRDSNPMTFQAWWLRNHSRYLHIAGIKQRELLLLHEMVIQFLSLFVRDQLRKKNGVIPNGAGNSDGDRGTSGGASKVRKTKAG